MELSSLSTKNILTFKSPLRSLTLRRVAVDLKGNFAIEKLSSAEILLTRLQNGQTTPNFSWVGLGAGFGGFYYRCSPTLQRFVKTLTGQVKLHF